MDEVLVMETGPATAKNDTADRRAMTYAVIFLGLIAAVVVATLAAMLWMSGPLGAVLLVALAFAFLAIAVVRSARSLSPPRRRRRRAPAASP